MQTLEYHAKKCLKYFIIIFILVIPEASSTMRAFSNAHCTDARLYTLRIKIDTNQRALDELLHCLTRLRFHGIYN